MATRITVQTPQARMTEGVGSQSWERYTPKLPNYSGIARGANALGNAFISKHKEKKAADERWEVFQDTQAFDYEIDGELNTQLPEDRDDLSARANTTRRISIANTMIAKHQERINERIGEMSMRFLEDPSITAAEAEQFMREGLQPMADKVPEFLRSDVQSTLDRGIDQATQTLGRLRLKEQNRATLSGIEYRLKDEADKAMAKIATGVEPETNIAAIEQAYDELVEMQLMTDEEADARFAAVTGTIRLKGTQNRIVNGIFTGEVDAAEAEAWAAKVLEGGGQPEDKITRTFRTDSEHPGMGELYVKEDLTVKDLAEIAQNDQLMKQFATDIGQAAGQFRQANKDLLKQRELFEWIQKNGENPIPLDADLRTIANDVFNEFVDNGMMQDNPAMVAALMSRIKYMPEAVERQLGVGLSGTPEDAYAAIEFYQAVKFGPNGGVITETMSESTKQQIEAVHSLARAVGNLDDPGNEQGRAQWAAAIERLQTGNMNTKKAIGLWGDRPKAGEYKLETSFDQAMRAVYSEQFPDAVGMSPQWKDQFIANYTAQMSRDDQDPEAALEFAAKWTADQFVQNPLTGNVSSTLKITDLRNPMVGEFANNLNPTAFADDYTRSQLTKISKDTPLNLDMYEQGVLTKLLQSNEPLFMNQHFRLYEFDENYDGGEYGVMFKGSDGSWIPLSYRGNDGRMKPVSLDYGSERAKIEAKGMLEGKITVEELQEKALTPINRQIMQWYRLQNPPGAEDNTPIDDRIFDNFHKKMLEGGNDILEERLLSLPPAVQEKLREQRNEVLNSPEYKDLLMQGFDIYQQKREERFEENSSGNNWDDSWSEEANVELMTTEFTSGREAAQMAVSMIEAIAPDGTGGNFMLNIAKVESDYGNAPNTFRTSGDTGIWQINTGDKGAYKEVKRRINQGGKLAAMAQKIDAAYGTDLANASIDDMATPLYSAAYARLYLMTRPGRNPTEPIGQALYWKEHYNTKEGAGKVSHFIDKWEEGNVEPVAYRQPGAAISAEGLRKYAAINGDVDEHLKFNPRFAQDLGGFLQAAEKAGHSIKVFSGYRSPERQAQIVIDRWSRYGGKKSDLKQFKKDLAKYGPEITGEMWRDHMKSMGMTKWIAPPGASNHQHGVAADLIDAKSGKRLDAHEARAARAWAHANAAKYGLHFRMGHEPWHIEPIAGRGA